MVKIQINLDKTENKLVEMYKAVHEMKTKEQAIRVIIQCYLNPDMANDDKEEAEMKRFHTKKEVDYDGK